MLTSSVIRKTLIILSIVGIGLASYLFYEYASPKPLGFCSISETVNCDPITKGVLATIFGIPVAIIGGVGYVTILLAAMAKKKKLALGMTAFGMLFCLRLSILEIFVEHVLCPVCLMCQIIMLVVFVLSLIWLKRED